MSEVIIKKPTPPEDPNHVAAMIAKAEGREAPATPETPAAAERPAWLPEGFDTPEQLAEAYKAKVAEPEPQAQTETDQAAADAVKNAGLDWSSLESKVIESGDLEASDYEALEKAGISRQMVESYIEGQRAMGEALLLRVHGHVGGRETFDSMVSWAASGGISQAEANAFNSVIDSGSEDQIKLALDGLKAKFVASGNQNPSLIGGGKGAGAADVYESIAQMMEDMADPRYSKDPAFRRAVEQRLGRSSIM